MKYIIVVGCGKTGRSLALELAQSHNVVVIDRSRRALDSLGETFNGKTVLGDALNVAVLEEAGIQEADALILVTGNDNFNIVVGKVAREMYKVKKVVFQVYEVNKKKIFSGEGLIFVNRTQLLVEVFKKCIL
jgi:trk system potassium uptake protein TrkA